MTRSAPSTPITTRCARWAEPALRTEVIERLANRGIDLDQLRRVAKQPDADPFDLLCHLAYQMPVHCRRERATRFRRRQAAFLAQYQSKPASSSTNCSKATPITDWHNSSYPMPSRSPPSPITATCWKFPVSSAVPNRQTSIGPITNPAIRSLMRTQ